jgi:hypothetical protein
VIPEPVAAVCRTFLDSAPEELVTGLYLRGGLAFGEWVPGQSDIDFVTTLSRRPTSADADSLLRAHEHVAQRHPDVHFGGMHVMAADLAADPASCPPGPTWLEGRFEAEGVLDPVIAWAELARGGLTISGPPVGELGIRTDPGRLRDFTRNNLHGYWRGTAEALASLPPEGASEEACCWCVLGVARLHHLLVTGEMTTKSRAGRWGLECYPSHFHRVLREALRIREGGPDEYVHEVPARGRDTAEFTAYVVDVGTAG